MGPSKGLKDTYRRIYLGLIPSDRKSNLCWKKRDQLEELKIKAHKKRRPRVVVKWSECSPSTPMVQYQILLKSTASKPVANLISN